MDATQTKIIELLREVHLLAIKEVERLNLRILELENRQHQPIEKPLPMSAIASPVPRRRSIRRLCPVRPIC
jgi:hypothetical protein